MTDETEYQLIACRPTDIRGLPEIPGVDLTAIVTILHTITVCDHCRRDCWIGPRQRDAYDAAPWRSTRLCYWCVVAMARRDGVRAEVRSLGGGDAPSRGV